jgi:dynein heavy chain
VDAFRATMPLLLDLRNSALRERHWLTLMEEIGQTFDYLSDQFTLEKVIELGLNEHGEFISALSTSATKELMVEQAITTIKQVWESLVLETIPYRDRGHHRIKTVEEIYANLDDNAVTLSTYVSC